MAYFNATVESKGLIVSLTNDPSDDVFIPAPITDSNFHDAVNLWFDNKAEANATYGHISDWNTSAVTNMSEAFKDRTTFNEDISGWDTSSVTNMEKMFYKAFVFNQPIGSWDVSSVGRMVDMFHKASAFNQPIGNWNVSSVNTMQSMFWLATSFNQPIGEWDVSSVKNLRSIFQWATSFNQDISGWDVSSVTNMREAFQFAHAFNQNLKDWNVSAVNSVYSVFRKAYSFDQDLSNWNIRTDTNMSKIFDDTSSLSDTNKGLLHGAFSSNPSWPYDWSVFAPAPSPPDGNYTSPEEDHLSPDDSYHTPEEGNGSPDTNYTTPDDDYQTPGDDYSTPEDNYSNYFTPEDEGHETPEENYETPDANYTTPSEEYDTPRDTYLTPGNGYITPDEDYGTPLDDDHSPDGNYTSPDDHYTTPGDEYDSPSDQFDTPSGEYVTPDWNYSTPDDAYQTPEEEYVTPGDGYWKPVDDYDDGPDTPYITPDSEYETPDWIDIGPSNAAPIELNSTEPLFVSENEPAGVQVGAFTALDPDGDALLFVLVDSFDGLNKSFVLDADGTLRTSRSFDFESDLQKMEIRVLAIDEKNASIEGSFLVHLINVIEDLDNDGYEDAFDEDVDGDGLIDIDEGVLGTDPRVMDTDDDGLLDGEEVDLGTNALIEDSDGDGLGDGTEMGIGTDPLLSDTDGDGFSDAEEVLAGSFPEDASDYPGKQLMLERDPNEFDGMIYEISEEKFTFDEAKLYADGLGADIPLLTKESLELPFLRELLIRTLGQRGTIWVMGEKYPSLNSILTARRELAIVSSSSNRQFQVLLVRPKPEVRLPGVLTLHPEIVGEQVFARAQIMDDGGETPFRIGFRISEKILVKENDPSARLISADLKGSMFEVEIDRLKKGQTYYIRAFAENSAGLLYGSVRKIRLEDEYLAPFDALPIGDGWYQSEWFGLFRVYKGVQWVYHTEFGWLYHGETNQNGIWFWSEGEGWLWSRLDTWPYVWRHNTSSWLYSFGIRQGRPTWWDYQNQSYLIW